jgi:hypothetical protein
MLDWYLCMQYLYVCTFIKFSMRSAHWCSMHKIDNPTVSVDRCFVFRENNSFLAIHSNRSNRQLHIFYSGLFRVGVSIVGNLYRDAIVEATREKLRNELG